jgi:methylenetetrahydrofolate dehydrogenase (NAD+)
MDGHTNGAGSCKVVLASIVAKDLLAEVSQGLSKVGKAPLLVGFLANKDPAARKYAEWTDRTCHEK